MIPGVMVDFLERASVAVASTRTRDLVPHLHFLSGWYVEPDKSILVNLVPDGFTDDLLASLEDNGQLAMTAEVIGPHETYQFKGTFEGARDVTEHDRAIHRACRQRFYDAVRRHYGDSFPDPAVLARIAAPAIAVRCRVSEIYVQTPGPAAGQRLYPARGRK
jgi:hypothetical protein